MNKLRSLKHVIGGVVLISFIGAGVGCNQEGQEEPSSQQETSGETQEQSSDNQSPQDDAEDSSQTGPGDVADYATGKKQLEMKENIEKRLDKAQEKKRQKMEDAGVAD